MIKAWFVSCDRLKVAFQDIILFLSAVSVRRLRSRFLLQLSLDITQEVQR